MASTKVSGGKRCPDDRTTCRDGVLAVKRGKMDDAVQNWNGGSRGTAIEDPQVEEGENQPRAMVVESNALKFRATVRYIRVYEVIMMC